jgi:hypothetical protein
MARMNAEHKKLDAKREASAATAKQPFRFYVEAGKSKEIVIVDEGITFARNEHALKHPRTGRFDLYLPCIAEVANCPVCSAHPEKEPYFAAFLTIIDLTEYDDSDGNPVYFSKRLLEIKPMQQKKFMRLQQQHGSLRGMVLTMTRDSKKDARIGNDIEFNGEVLSEDDLATYERSYIDRQEKEQVIIGHEPYNYEEIMPDLSEQQLRLLVNGKPDAGSRDFERQELDDGDAGDGFEDDTQRPQRRAPRGSAQQRGNDAPQRARTAPARQEADDDRADDDAPPQRTGSRTPPPRTATTRANLRQQRAPEPEPEEEEQEAPPPRRSIAQARQALRRRS